VAVLSVTAPPLVLTSTTLFAGIVMVWESPGRRVKPEFGESVRPAVPETVADCWPVVPAGPAGPAGPVAPVHA
jgi:hypothetical protein